MMEAYLFRCAIGLVLGLVSFGLGVFVAYATNKAWHPSGWLPRPPGVVPFSQSSGGWSWGKVMRI